jgi:uncharacterized protein (DUF1015 family)
MPTVLPLRGLRYDPKHVGALSPVIAPPHDGIDGGLQNALYERHPANAVRLERNRVEPGDDAQANGPARAARLLRAWREQGVLMQEPAAAVYVCHQACEVEGRPLVRRGVLARVRLERFGTGNIHPHEDTSPEPKADRLALLRACRTNVSPVFGLYPDPEGEVQAILDAAVAGQPPVEADDHLGGRTALWPVTDEAVAAKVARLLGPLPVVIADGHHRYEAACDYRDEVAAAWAAEHDGQPLPSDHLANFVLMMLVGMSDRGLVASPAHRLFEQPTVATAADLCSRLGDCFTTRTSWRGPAAAETVWANIELEEDQGTIGLFTPGDQAWTLARITPAGRARLEAIAGEHGATWRGLGVTILHRLLIDDLLGMRESPAPRTLHDIAAVAETLAAGGSHLAAVVMPVTAADIRRVSETGERLPAGSTCFHPPIPTGLVFNPVG